MTTIWLPFNSLDPNNAAGSTGRVADPGTMQTYEFSVPWSVAPGDDDPDCLVYLYYSDYEMEHDVSTGLVGPLLICRPGTLDEETGKQVIFFFIILQVWTKTEEKNHLS